VSIRVKNRPPNIVVQIADSGVGIPQDELPFIFEPFYRVDKSRTKDTGGYGLGLSLCKTIMEAHGGRIEIESTSSVGTTVTLVFPA
jgi:signal transduction histidine kinase